MTKTARIVALVSISLFSARAFSISNHQTHSTRHLQQMQGNYHQRPHYLPTETASFRFTKTINGRDGSVGNHPRPSTRTGSISIPYPSYDLGLLDPTRLNDNEEEDYEASRDPIRYRHSDDRLESFMEHRRWVSLKQMIVSQSDFSFVDSRIVSIPKGVSALVFSSPGIGKNSSPLVLIPDHPRASSEESLQSFLRKNRQWVEERILEYGAVTFRGFGLENAFNKRKRITAIEDSEYDEDGRSSSGYNEVLRAFDPGCSNREPFSSSTSFDVRNGFEYYLVMDENTNPRQHEPSSPLDALATRTRRYSDTGAASRKDLLEIGIGTRLTDFRRIYNDLPTRLRRKLTQKNLLYKRSLENFGFLAEAFRFHPKTNEKVWFKLAHSFHWTSLPAELFEGFKRTGNPKILVRALREAFLGLWKRCTGGGLGRQPLVGTKIEVAYGDGRPISAWEMHQIRSTLRRNTPARRWRHGDLLMVDGLSMGLQR